MICAECLRDSQPGARFCGHCGAPLTLPCGGCGSALPLAARFCPKCGRATGSPPDRADPAPPSPGSYTPLHLAEKILLSRASLEGERKQVTVLFADISASMELLADRDPEEARRLLDPVVELMMEAVHHYEGTVSLVLGDGIMALFGAPLAYEDHAVRACLAALRMQAAVRRHAASQTAAGPALRIRVGLNSGEVVVRSIGNDLRMDYSAVGQTTHLASRMEQMAEPGSILATHDTFRLVEGYVQAASLGRVVVRGLDATVEVHVITGPGPVRSSLDAAVSRGLAPFVGREEELARLDAARQSAAEGRGRAVGLVGEPGVGKSRLLHEFTRPERMPGWRVLKAGAVSYGKGTAYGPVIDLLRAYFMVTGRDAVPVVRDRVATALRALDPSLLPMAPALLLLMDIPAGDAPGPTLSPRERRTQTMRALQSLVVAESRALPLCIVLEDLHWIDSETQKLLDTLIEGLAPERILLLVDFRPEYRHGWAACAGYAEFRVDALPPPSAHGLLHGLLGSDESLAPLAELLVERTAGNPFFLEESVRALAGSGALAGARGAYRLARPVETITVPPTVQAVLAARIDRLGAEDKRLLECAAVIGDSVPARLLQEVAEMSPVTLSEGLHRLRAAEFLHDVGPSAEPTDVFRHGLTCRVAYGSLLHERRRALHAKIVQAIERVYPDRLEEHVERLAHHARQAELWAQAVRHLRHAGTKAFARSANRQAAAWFEQALEVLARIPDAAPPDEAVDLHFALRNALTALGEHDRTLEHLRRAQALAERLGDRRRLGRALSFEANCLSLLGQHESAIECASRSRAVAANLDDLGLRTMTDIYAGRAHLSLGDYARAIQIFGSIVDSLAGPLAHQLLGVPILPSVFARGLLVESLAAVGRFEEGARYGNESIALAEASKYPDTMLWAYHGTGVHHLARGDVPLATVALERAHTLCRTHDMPVYLPRISAIMAVAWAHGGRAAEAVPIVERALEEATARRQVASYSYVLGYLAEVFLLAGRPDAIHTALRALDVFRRQRERGHEARALWLLAEIRAQQGAAAAAETTYAEASLLCERLGMRPLRARCALGLARLLKTTGRGDCARAAFEAARAGFRELRMTAELARTEAELGAVT